MIRTYKDILSENKRVYQRKDRLNRIVLISSLTFDRRDLMKILFLTFKKRREKIFDLYGFNKYRS